MRVVVNGEARDVRSGVTVAELVHDVGRDPQKPGTAIARNGEVVPRGAWATTALDADDHVEVLTAVAGG